MTKKRRLIESIADLKNFLQTLNKEQITQHKIALEKAVTGLGALTYLVDLIDDETD